MNAWKPIATAPAETWVLVRKAGGFGVDPQGGPWDYGRDKYPGPKVMVAILLPEDRGAWRAYSEDGGIYGTIDTPDEWMEVPE